MKFDTEIIVVSVQVCVQPTNMQNGVYKQLGYELCHQRNRLCIGLWTVLFRILLRIFQENWVDAILYMQKMTEG